MFCHYPLLRICSYSHIEQILNYDMVLLPCDAMRSTVLVIVILSVRPSVCLSLCPSVCHTRGLCPHGSTYDHDFFTVW